jgi:hypothetical protein
LLAQCLRRLSPRHGRVRAAHCPTCDTPQLVPVSAKGWLQRDCHNKSCITTFDVAPVNNDPKSTFWFLYSGLKDDYGGVDDGWRTCPGCDMIVSKGVGCDDMVCACGTSFSWKDAKVNVNKHRG